MASPSKKIKVNDEGFMTKNPPGASFDPPSPFYKELILGASDTGKTNYLKWSIRREAHNFQCFIFIGPNVNTPKHGLQDIISELHGSGKTVVIFTQFTPNLQTKFYKLLERNLEGGWSTMVSVDDPIGMTAFTKAINTDSAWNALMTGVKHKQVCIKFSVQGERGISDIARKQCDRVVRYSDYETADSMHKWCGMMSSPSELARLMNYYHRQPYNAVVFCKYRGTKALFHVTPTMTVKPISGYKM